MWYDLYQMLQMGGRVVKKRGRSNRIRYCTHVEYVCMYVHTHKHSRLDIIVFSVHVFEF